MAEITGTGANLSQRPLVGTGVPTRPLKADTAAGAGNIRESIPAGAPPGTRPVGAPIPEAAPEVVVQPGEVPATEIRAATPRDIATHLAALGLPTNGLAFEIATKLQQYGIELTPQTLQTILTMINGSENESTWQAALLLLARGTELQQSGTAQVLAEFLGKNHVNLVTQLVALQQMVGNAQVVAQQMNITFISQLVGLLANLDQNLVDGKYFSMQRGRSTIERGKLLSDVRAAQAGLDSAIKQLSGQQDPSYQALLQNLLKAREQANQVIRQLTSEMLISEKVERTDLQKNYYYVQIPIMQAKKNVELLVERDANGQIHLDGGPVRVVLALNTVNMDELSVDMTVNDKKVDFVFAAKTKEVQSFIGAQGSDLGKRLESRGMQLGKFQAQVAPEKTKMKHFYLPPAYEEERRIVRANA